MGNCWGAKNAELSQEEQRKARRQQVRGAMKAPMAANFVANEGGQVRSSTVQRRSEKDQDKIDAALRKSGPSDFVVASVVGTGSFGCVKMARHRINGEQCAVKVTHKNNAAVALKEGRHVESEANDVLEKLSHPFIVRTYNTAWVGDEVWTFMELVEGGEMYRHFSPKNPMSTSVAKVYVAQIILALDALHRLGVVYHDLKPNNMLLSKQGDIKIIDFGLATSGNSGGKDKCTCRSGTMPYMAPELLAGQTHNRMIDWWALGVVMFEFLTGSRPFDASTDAGILKRAYKGIPWAQMASQHNISYAKEATNFIDALLQADMVGRLGWQKGGAEVKKHALFSGFEWDRLAKGKISPPFSPGVTLDAGGGMAGAMFSAAGGGMEHGRGGKVAPAAAEGNQTSAKYKMDEEPNVADFRKKHK